MSSNHFSLILLAVKFCEKSHYYYHYNRIYFHRYIVRKSVVNFSRIILACVTGETETATIIYRINLISNARETRPSHVNQFADIFDFFIILASIDGFRDWLLILLSTCMTRFSYDLSLQNLSPRLTLQERPYFSHLNVC